MAEGIERFSAPAPGDEFDPKAEAQFRRLSEQFMENADYRVRDLGDDVESIDTTVTDHESRITTLENEGGGWELIEKATVSGAVSEVDFTEFLDAAYRDYVFLLSSVVPATDGVDLYLRTSTDGGSNWDSGASDYSWAAISLQAGGTAPPGSGTTGDSQVVLNGTDTNVGSTTDGTGWSGRILMFSPSGADFTNMKWEGLFARDTNAALVNVEGSGRRAANEDVDSVRFLFSSGNVESGQISLYGIKDS